ncbi:hypothetical protein KVR01_000309 [Diaporthe batatas]|uniref:uncharacterized protein n=1 Tax=Diaporthe batatas TaxID=748121 RepID=UPI001D03FFF3|nr:uncharacterized protein KVR01_000309 [Diaporthe batatas]KAG8169564.1 hypothetical protein KVR01_000309 [Diaporthe batatas]
MMSANMESGWGLLRHGRFGLQRTPEPSTEAESQAPSTPRPRLRLKRRHDPQHLAAPTQQFLASVAAADVPLPSVEEPAIATYESDVMSSWNDLQFPDEGHDIEHCLHVQYGHNQSLTSPKTPAPGAPPSLTPSRYPNWANDWVSSSESSPEPESRPSTARSRTSTSSFSQLSSCFSDDDLHFSPETGGSEKSMCVDSEAGQSESLQLRSATRIARKAPWTPAMSQHLWATYNMYLSDPRVTPFQIGKSGIPPEGVSKRVARQAIRSWKGSRTVARTMGASEARSGSSTPTAAESSGVFMQWPHTAAATRAHLRTLCKQKARGPDGGKMRFSYFSRSPTPLTDATVRWARRSTPGSAPTPFGTQEMAKSLAMSTSEIMTPQGPLAQLTSAGGSDALTITPNLDHVPPPDVDLEPSMLERRRLGSPVNAKSYGPSSSTSLLDVFGLSADVGQRQTHTVGPRRTLQSPVRLSRSSTQKRKTRQAHESRKRPSLSLDTWLDPRILASDSSKAEDAFFASRPRAPLSFDSAQPTARPAVVPIATPPRLGSPFSASSSMSLSVPNRFSQPTDLEPPMFARRCSTVHQSRGTHPTEPASVNLASRLAYLDQRLKDFNGPSRRLSESSL